MGPLFIDIEPVEDNLCLNIKNIRQEHFSENILRSLVRIFEKHVFARRTVLLLDVLSHLPDAAELFPAKLASFGQSPVSRYVHGFEEVQANVAPERLDLLMSSRVIRDVGG